MTYFTVCLLGMVADGIMIYLTADAVQHLSSVEADTAGAGIAGLVGLVTVAAPTVRLVFGLIRYGRCRQHKADCVQRSFVVRSGDGGRHWSLLSLDPPATAAPPCVANQLVASGALR